MSITPPPPQPRSISIAEPSPTAAADPRMDTITEHVEAKHISRNRARSVPSLTFSVGKGKPQVREREKSTPSPSASVRSLHRAIHNVRPREKSPPPGPKFQQRVTFDNIDQGDPTKDNAVSFTLNIKHEGYAYRRRSRTFMVGVDDNPYSDIALQWMLEELVDDGDQIVCLRVIDRDAKIVSEKEREKKRYQDEARACLEQIQRRNDDHRAINIILEYAVGKLEGTFLKMIEIYEPAMLVVGTRGRSLGGFQGLMANRNSFSKWCLQYSPIPVVVVRPTEKRLKKKMKRDADPGRQGYASILRDSGIHVHETEITPNARLFEAANNPDAEAHAVAAVLGLPAQFDPTIKALDLPGTTPLRKVLSGDTAITETSETTFSRSPSPEIHKKEGLSKAMAREEEESEDEEEASDNESSEDEFEATPANKLLADEQQSEVEKKRRLHDMEVGEAAALAAAASRKGSIGSESSSGSGGGVSIKTFQPTIDADRKDSIDSQSSVASVKKPGQGEQEEEDDDNDDDDDDGDDEEEKEVQDSAKSDSS
ncbi:hypothetical protein BP5796_08408 [Coleophoma crateriformis]|uniref:UspA domain-containing protein n=1 Tax=Coleophoma crateriformis TaxID=565419 RepID=A0A3D8R7T6_9HELO|nr:hypothetical protein BP5796_08408 [Coleophoma crateriformis]